MIPTTANDSQLAGYVDNIVAAFRSATASQLATGRAWYPVAHDMAELIGSGDVRMGAGVLAALSPKMPWARNAQLGTDAGNGNVHGQVGRALRTVREILDGSDPATLLPMDAKTGNFYRNILDPTDPDPVTIDRWAYRVATGQYDTGSSDLGLSNRTRYATLALAYRLAARRLHEVPSVVQAVTWVWAREVKA